MHIRSRMFDWEKPMVPDLKPSTFVACAEGRRDPYRRIFLATPSAQLRSRVSAIFDDGEVHRFFISILSFSCINPKLFRLHYKLFWP